MLVKKESLHPIPYTLHPRQGFTLIELLIYTGLTVIILGLLGGILVTVTRIQGVQDSSIQVTKELNFLMNTIKQNIYSADSIVVNVTGTEIELTEDGDTKKISYVGTPDFKVTTTDPMGVTTDLSGSRLKIDNLSFTDLRKDATASRAIQIEITATANTDNVQKTFQRTIRSTVAPFVQEP